MNKKFTKWLAAALLLLLITPPLWVWGQTRTEEVYKTALFGSSYNSQSVGSYTATWYATNNGFRVDLQNFNNNNNSWDYVKCGRKNNVSVATIITNAAIDVAITKVDVTIDVITSANVNSIKLYTSSNGSTWTEAGSYTKATGTQSVSLSSPTANLYYKLEFDCASGSNNGLIQISKVEYYHNTGSGSTVATPTFDPDGGTYTEEQLVEIECETENAVIYYTTDGTTPNNNSTEYDPNEGVTISETTTLKAIAYLGNDASSEASATYTIVTPLTTMQAIFDRATAIGSTAQTVTITFNNWVVSGKSSSYAYVTDGTKGFVITNYGGHGFNVGDVLSGTSSCLLRLNYGYANLQNFTSSAEGLTVNSNGTVEIANIGMSDLSGVNSGALLHYDNLTCSKSGSNYYLTDGTTTIQVYTTLYSGFTSVLQDGKNYNITGVYQQYNTTKEICPRSAADIVEYAGPSIEATPSPFTAPSYVVETTDPTYNVLTVNGSNLTANISLSLGANSNFEMSTDLSTWSSSLSLTQANGSVTNAQVGIRLKAGLAKGSYNGTLTLSSTDATDVIVALSGTVTGQTYAINIDNDITGGTIAADLATAEEGATITLTATPDAAYNFSDWMVLEADQTTEVTVTNNQFTMPACQVYVTAEFTAKPTNAIICVISPIGAAEMVTDATNDLAYEGQLVTLTIDNIQTGYTFSGIVITKTEDGTATDINPTASDDNYTFTMPGYAVTATATFLSENYNGSFVRFEDELVEGDYLIVYDGGAMNNVVSSKRFGYVAVTESENNVISNPSNNIVWHIAPSETEGYWTLYNAKIGQYAASAGTSSDMSLESSATEDKALWKASGTYEFRNKGNESATTRYLRRNGTYGFANYSTSTGGALTLYKLIPNVAPAWAPEFPTNAEIITGTPYELTVSDFVTGIPTPSISITTSVSSSLYEFEDGEFMFQPSEAGTFVFTFSATNTEGSVAATLTITVNEPAQLQYVYSSNGMLGTPQSIAQGQSINSLAAGANLNDDFVFVGWTTDPSDVEHILEAGSSYTVNEATTFYAVYSRTVNVAKEKIVVLDGDAPELTSTAHALTLSENGFTYYASSAKYQVLGSGAENNVSSGKTILIGKQGAYLYNTTAFDQGITKFEIYANAGAAAGVSVGINFSASTISEYNAAAENTWTATLSTRDYVYDASEALPQGAKYFWYQVTNANNSQVQFRITYTATESATTYYTRVFLNETASAIITIAGPSIIPSGSMLDMGEYTLSNDDPANLIIKDGGQLKVYDNGAKAGVQATVEKSIAAWTTDPVGGWYFIASPVNVTDYSPASAGLITDDFLGEQGTADTRTYDFYYLGYEDSKPTWKNYRKAQFNMANGQGYLYANANDQTLAFAGAVKPYSEENNANQVAVDAGWNLVGNPYTFNTYVNDSYYKLNNERTAIEAVNNKAAIAPCTGIIVKAENSGNVTFSETPSGGSKGSVGIMLSKAGTRSNATLDNAIVSFNEGSQLEKFYFMQQNANLYIPQGKEEYAIVNAQAQGEMPVNFRANTNGQYTLTVNAENVEMNYLHLIDNMTGADIDLLQTPSYTFNAKTYDYESRFRLVFAANSNDNASAGSETFAFFANGNLIINNEGEATLQVIDMTGRVLRSEAINGSANIGTKGLATGVYVLRLVNGNNIKTQKMVVE